MAKRIKFRIELNKGRIGIPIHKLARINDESEKFIKALAEDMNIKFDHNKWIALNFENNSVDYDVECQQEEISDLQADNFVEHLERIWSSPAQAISQNVNQGTVKQYLKIAEHLDVDESIFFYLYKNGGPPSSTYQLSKSNLPEIMEHVEDVVQYHGAIRGIIHELHMGGGNDKPYFKLRDTISDKLIKCYFDDRFYEEIIDILKIRGAIIHATGLIVASRTDRALKELQIGSEDRIEPAVEYKAGDLEKFFGCVPDILGGMTMEDFMDDVRRRNE